MPVYAIPETRERCYCPSLYTIIQFLCSVASFSILVLCFSSDYWIEKFVYYGSWQFRILSIGLWQICLYGNTSFPSVPTECSTVRYNDFTLTVQICQCIAVAASSIAIILALVRMCSPFAVSGACVTCDETQISYETRKYRIVCYLITILSVLVSLPLFIFEAHIEGVRLGPLMRHQDLVTNIARQHVNNSVSATTVVPTLAPNSTEVEGVAPDHPNLPQYSVFAWALWMEFSSLALTMVIFVMAIVKHVKKRKQRFSTPISNRTKTSRPRPSLSLELKGRPRSESQRAFVRQSSSVSMQELPSSP